MFTDIDEALLKELIPKIGPRIKFKRQIDLLKAEIDVSNAAVPSTSKQNIHVRIYNSNYSNKYRVSRI